MTRAKATCLCCSTVLPPDRVKAQLSAEHGGADAIFENSGGRTSLPIRVGGARLLSVVTLQENTQGRHYRLATNSDYAALEKAQQKLKFILDKWEHGGRQGLCPVPDEPTPPPNGHRSTTAPRSYGINSWRYLYTTRQLLSMLSYTSSISSYNADVNRIHSIQEILALSVSKLAERLNIVCDWMVGVECSGHLYSHHDIPASWDFSEAVTIASSSGSFDSVLETIDGSLNAIGSDWKIGQVSQFDACEPNLPNESAQIWFTDPPYYDAVAYSDLSNLFYTWLKRAIPNHSLLKDG